MTYERSISCRCVAIRIKRISVGVKVGCAPKERGPW